MKFTKKTFFLLLVVGTGLFLYPKEKGSFSEKDLFPLSEANSCWSTVSLDTSFPVDAVLSQKFYFLGKGHQALAFESEDGQYVLKLFKPHYPHINILGSFFNFTPIPFSRWIYRNLYPKAFAQGIKEDLTSYVNALTKFQKESLVEYLHLTKTNHLQNNIQIFDKKTATKKKELSANNTCFLIQKKVIPLEDFLAKAIQENRKEEIEKVFHDLITLLHKRVDLGFCKPTHKFHVNFGCVGLETVQLDIGRLLTAEDLSEPLKSHEYPSKAASSQKLKEWVMLRYPELLDCLPKDLLKE